MMPINSSGPHSGGPPAGHVLAPDASHGLGATDVRERKMEKERERINCRRPPLQGTHSCLRFGGGRSGELLRRPPSD